MKRGWWVLLCMGWLGVAHAQPLPDEVKEALVQARIPVEAVGIVVREVDAEESLISQRAQQPMNPASTMKIVTTFAALDLLGPAYDWKTEAYMDGALQDGVLQGNLILKGYGNPKLTMEQFWLWLGELRARGLRDIQGDLVLDRSYFDIPLHDPGEFDNDPLRAYNVGPDALLLNFNTLRVRYLTDNGALRIITEPELEGVRIDNRLTLRSKNCNVWNAAVQIQTLEDRIVWQGDYPIACGEQEQNLNLLPQTKYVEAVFRALWRGLGGRLTGQARDGIAGDTATLFSVHRSEPLSDIIRDINKFSNNVMARQLLLTLGAATDPVQTSSEKPRMSLAQSRSVMDTWLQRQGIQIPGWVLENGSGLSRTERITPAGMAEILQIAAAHPYSAEFESSLPIIGVDGTVRKRLRNEGTAGRAHLKTGTLEGVRTLAGYVHSHSGKRWVLVFFINHENAKYGQAAQDALVEWLVEK